MEAPDLMISRSSVLAAAAFATSIAGAAQPASARPHAAAVVIPTTMATGTVSATDATAHTLTVSFRDGTARTIAVAPSVERFAVLKAGETVTLTITLPLVYGIVNPNLTPPTPTPVGTPSPTPADLKTVVVTVLAIDPSTPAITIKGTDGSIAVDAVSDAKVLAGVKAGDVVALTYADATVIGIR